MKRYQLQQEAPIIIITIISNSHHPKRIIQLTHNVHVYAFALDFSTMMIGNLTMKDLSLTMRIML